ncbi:hypothetical protein Efla_002421 [Eimeria flavescens]
MVYDQYARVLFPGRQLRRFVEIPTPEERFPECLDLEFSYALTVSRRETREHVWEDFWRRWTALQSDASIYPYRGGIRRPRRPANPLFPEPPVSFHAVQYPEDRWEHPHGNLLRVEIHLVTYYVHQRFSTSSYPEYEQSPSSSGDDQPPSPQQQVQERITNRLILTRRHREDNLEAECSSRKQGPFGATEVPRLQGSPSLGVSANEGPPSYAESSPQEVAGDEPLAAPPAPEGGAGDG